MDGMNPLMRYALSRGEGLLPELLSALVPCDRQADSNVVHLAAYSGHLVQAGPNPVAPLPLELPDNVVLFRQGDAKAVTTPAKPARAPRKSRAPRLLNRKD